jgi:hypothetical protein
MINKQKIYDDEYIDALIEEASKDTEITLCRATIEDSLFEIKNYLGIMTDKETDKELIDDCIGDITDIIDTLLAIVGRKEGL